MKIDISKGKEANICFEIPKTKLEQVSLFIAVA